MTEYLTSSPEETEAVGEKLAAAVAYRPFAFVALYGELGVGKTAFVRGFCRVFGIDRVKSPTFTVVNEYRGTKNVFHMDLYRLRDEDDLLSVGYEDYLGRRGYVLCEWSEKIPSAIPDDAIRVTISKTDGENGRKIVIDGCPELA
ncbi:MAG: tRNA (adenosine(37)-N6)-threonylcarbamoyltransferase complex ATPase subunit type 1 TsaE [Clostridia bacterium]|nr:tRNA (adenosine(37)-N6)-threonylcarbamoyltransferase complex ATPase subunit type 1 TsaE [Clostridia bacterium]